MRVCNQHRPTVAQQLQQQAQAARDGLIHPWMVLGTVDQPSASSEPPCVQPVLSTGDTLAKLHEIMRQSNKRGGAAAAMKAYLKAAR